MDNLWTWGGIYFGYKESNNLWTHTGKHVGRFYDDEVYSLKGDYLGEIKNENRLITDRNKISKRKGSILGLSNRTIGRGMYANYVGYVMYVGCEDFPSPDTF